MEGIKTLAESFIDEAEKAEHTGMVEAALEFYVEALRVEPRSSSACLGFCSLLRRADRPAEALARCAAFAAVSPNDAAALHEMGLCLLAVKKNEDAVRAFGRALELEPGYSSAWRNMGIALGRMGRTEQAFRCFDRAEGWEPEPSKPEPQRWPAPEFGTAMHELMAGLMETGGGCAHIIVEAPFSFKAAVAALEILLTDYDMDGVVVSIGRPVEIYRQVLGRRINTPHPPYYIDMTTWPVENIPQPASREDAVVSAFEPDRIAASVRLGLQKVAERYGGEEHFVLMDDLAAMEAYNGPEVVCRFVGEFFRKLSALHIFSFVIIPETKASQFFGPASFSAYKKLRVESKWLMPF